MKCRKRMCLISASEVVFGSHSVSNDKDSMAVLSIIAILIR